MLAHCCCCCRSLLLPLVSRADALQTNATHPISPQIAKTDTLAGLAVKYNVTVADIKRANGLMSDSGMYARGVISIPMRQRPGPAPGDDAGVLLLARLAATGCGFEGTPVAGSPGRLAGSPRVASRRSSSNPPDDDDDNDTRARFSRRSDRSAPGDVELVDMQPTGVTGGEFMADGGAGSYASERVRRRHHRAGSGGGPAEAAAAAAAAAAEGLAECSLGSPARCGPGTAGGVAGGGGGGARHSAPSGAVTPGGSPAHKQPRPPTYTPTAKFKRSNSPPELIGAAGRLQQQHHQHHIQQQQLKKSASCGGLAAAQDRPQPQQQHNHLQQHEIKKARSFSHLFGTWGSGAGDSSSGGGGGGGSGAESPAKGGGPVTPVKKEAVKSD
jgi:LysM repeat protein